MFENSERLKSMFCHKPEYRRDIYIYLTHPGMTTDPDRLQRDDKCAAEKIKDLQSAIDDLQEYRAALSLRYNELTTQPYTLKLSLTRHRSYRDSHTTYTVKITRTYADTTSHDQLIETYPGKERHTAIARYHELLKSHPGIESEMDIEKRAWEK